MDRKLINLSVAVAALALTNSAQALDLDVGIKASTVLGFEAGLDQKTRELIQGMPEEVRVQTISLLKEALPLIDASVQSYITAVDGVLQSRISQLQCTVVGAGRVLGADFKSTLPFSSAPRPLKELSDDRTAVTNDFSQDDSVEVYRQQYADLLYRSANTACQVQQSEEALIGVRKIQDEVRPRWNTWYRVPDNCGKAEDCYLTTYGVIDILVKSSDPRDVAEANAGARLLGIQKPTIPGYFDGWDPTQHELAIKELLSIQDAILTSLAARQAVAAELVRQASLAISQAESHMANARLLAERKFIAPPVPEEIRSSVRSAVDLAAAAHVLIGKALAISDTSKADFDNLMPKITSIDSIAPSLIETASEFQRAYLDDQKFNFGPNAAPK